jgi:hypothetical protein
MKQIIDYNSPLFEKFNIICMKCRKGGENIVFHIDFDRMKVEIGCKTCKSYVKSEIGY